MRYFRLFPDCHYIVGEGGGLLLILSTQETKHLSKRDNTILQHLQSNTAEDTIEKFGPYAQSLTDHLVRSGLGTLYDQPVYVEKFQLNSPLNWSRVLDVEAPVIKAAYLEITAKCSANCFFCTKKKNPDYYVYHGSSACVRWPGNPDTLRNPDTPNISRHLKTIIDDINDLEVRNLVISGGNPLLEWDLVEKIAKNIRVDNKDIKINIITNGSMLSEDIVKSAQKYKINFTFTIFGSSTKTYHQITGNGKLLEELKNSVSMCQINSLDFATTLVFTEENICEKKEMLDLSRKFGCAQTNGAEIISALHPQYLNEGRIRRSSLDEFSTIDYFSNMEKSPCLDGIVAFSLDGRILPCPFWRREIGRFPFDSLRSLIERANSMDKKDNHLLWNLTKDNIGVCNKCEYRYICRGCPAIDIEKNTNPDLHEYLCDYNPVTGKWNNNSTTHSRRQNVLTAKVVER